MYLEPSHGPLLHRLPPRKLCRCLERARSRAIPELGRPKPALTGTVNEMIAGIGNAKNGNVKRKNAKRLGTGNITVTGMGQANMPRTGIPYLQP